MPFTYRPHELSVDPLTHVVACLQLHDSICLMNGQEQFNIQHGQVFYQGAGNPVPKDELPGWFWEQCRALTPQARKSCGFTLPEDEVHTVSDLPTDFIEQFRKLSPEIQRQLASEAGINLGSLDKKSDPDPEPDPEDDSISDEVINLAPEPKVIRVWGCPHCHQELPMARKGVHLALRAKHGRCF